MPAHERPIPGPKPGPDWLPHVLPYVTFLAVGAVGGLMPESAQPFVYAAMFFATAVPLLWFALRGAYPELEFRPSILGIAAGVAGFGLWIVPLPHFEETGYDPHAAGPEWFLALVIVRTAGAVILVPIFEELFLRSFLIRYLDMLKEKRDEWRDLPIGRYRLFSFVGVAVAMAVTHHRPIHAALWSMLVTLVLYREKRMGAVIWAHAVTNLCLTIHVLVTKTWTLW